MVTWTGDNWFELSSKLDTIPKGGVKENRYPYDMWNLYPFCMDVLRIWCIVVDFVLWCISGWCGQHIWSHCIWMLLFGATKPGFDVFLAYFNRLVSFLQSMMLVRFYSVCQHVVLMEEVVLFRIWHVKRFFTWFDRWKQLLVVWFYPQGRIAEFATDSNACSGHAHVVFVCVERELLNHLANPGWVWTCFGLGRLKLSCDVRFLVRRFGS